jgi:AcrR family transcriptional regulator
MSPARASTPRPPAPAKVRILKTADRLFYAEGAHIVGVDRLIASSHVTKATFYKHYRSKDILLAAFVTGRDEKARERVAELRATRDGAAVIRAMVDDIAEEATRSGYRGCLFINAATSQLDAAGPVGPVVTAWRSWLRATLVELFAQAGSADAESAADDFLLARDGAFGGGPVADAEAAVASLHRATERLLS